MVALADNGRAEASLDEGTESGQVDVRRLAPGTEVIVDTAHSIYRLLIIDGEAGLARVQGGRMFLESTAVRIEGTRNREHELMIGVLRVGRGFDFIAWNERGRTSPVQSIAVSAPRVLSDTAPRVDANGDQS
jgi:hypothetical protein